MVQDPRTLSRRDKFQFLKNNGVKCHATMTNEELTTLIDQLEMGGDPEEMGVTSFQDKKRRDKKKKRVPLGTFRSKLSVEGYNIPKDKVPRWVNDIPGRIQLALEGGYELVRDPQKEIDVGEDPLRTRDINSAVSAIVGEKDGQPQRAFLMVIDRDLYNQDQADKQRILDEMDAAIHRGEVEPGEGQYIPKEGIKYQTTKK